jgi:RNA polymerase sigma-70 factor (ECF subfamily)
MAVRGGSRAGFRVANVLLPTLNGVESTEAGWHRMSREHELTRRAQAGDREAFGEIVRLLEGEVLNFAYRLHPDRSRAEDLSQDAFVEAFRRLRHLHDPAQLRGWVRGIVRNLHRARRRREAREPASLDLSGEECRLAAADAGEADLFAGMAPKEIFEILATEVDRLPEPYRAVVVLRHYDRLTCRAIAERLGVPIGTVTMRLTRGHRMLREAVVRHAGRTWRT